MEFAHIFLNELTSWSLPNDRNNVSLITNVNYGDRNAKYLHDTHFHSNLLDEGYLV